ncbi:MAG: 50S ribosomal protein L44e [Candidatus Diapherotrites archaeon]|nr:50S ribosomal protein L44e [Candidatus Diapherotrites archaeon]MDZ4256309.1 50S ribosomal protein L44e [archaeon]
MKIPRSKKLYCKKCNAHSDHKLKAFKSGSPRVMAIGQRRNIRKHKKGYGGKAKFVIPVKKQTKKPVFLAECGVCKMKKYYVIPKRMKKAELATA